MDSAGPPKFKPFPNYYKMRAAQLPDTEWLCNLCRKKCSTKDFSETLYFCRVCKNYECIGCKSKDVCKTPEEIEAEAKKKKEEEERKRLEEEAEKARKQAEEDAIREAAEEEARRQAAEEEARRLAEEQERLRQAQAAADEETRLAAEVALARMLEEQQQQEAEMKFQREQQRYAFVANDNSKLKNGDPLIKISKKFKQISEKINGKFNLCDCGVRKILLKSTFKECQKKYQFKIIEGKVKTQCFFNNIFDLVHSTSTMDNDNQTFICPKCNTITCFDCEEQAQVEFTFYIDYFNKNQKFMKQHELDLHRASLKINACCTENTMKQTLRPDINNDQCNIDLYQQGYIRCSTGLDTCLVYSAKNDDEVFYYKPNSSSVLCSNCVTKKQNDRIYLNVQNLTFKNVIQDPLLRRLVDFASILDECASCSFNDNLELKENESQEVSEHNEDGYLADPASIALKERIKIDLIVEMQACFNICSCFLYYKEKGVKTKGSPQVQTVCTGKNLHKQKQQQPHTTLKVEDDNFDVSYYVCQQFDSFVEESKGILRRKVTMPNHCCSFNSIWKPKNKEQYDVCSRRKEGCDFLTIDKSSFFKGFCLDIQTDLRDGQFQCCGIPTIKMDINQYLLHRYAQSTLEITGIQCIGQSDPVNVSFTVVQDANEKMNLLTNVNVIKLRTYLPQTKPSPFHVGSLSFSLYDGLFLKTTYYQLKKQSPQKFSANKWTCALKGVKGCLDKQKFWNFSYRLQEAENTDINHCSECSYSTCYSCDSLYPNSHQHKKQGNLLKDIKSMHTQKLGLNSYYDIYAFQCDGEQEQTDCKQSENFSRDEILYYSERHNLFICSGCANKYSSKALDNQETEKSKLYSEIVKTWFGVFEENEVYTKFYINKLGFNGNKIVGRGSLDSKQVLITGEMNGEQVRLQLVVDSKEILTFTGATRLFLNEISGIWTSSISKGRMSFYALDPKDPRYEKQIPPPLQNYTCHPHPLTRVNFQKKTKYNCTGCQDSVNEASQYKCGQCRIVYCFKCVDKYEYLCADALSFIKKPANLPWIKCNKCRQEMQEYWSNEKNFDICEPCSLKYIGLLHLKEKVIQKEKQPTHWFGWFQNGDQRIPFEYTSFFINGGIISGSGQGSTITGTRSYSDVQFTQLMENGASILFKGKLENDNRIQGEWSNNNSSGLFVITDAIPKGKIWKGYYEFAGKYYDLTFTGISVINNQITGKGEDHIGYHQISGSVIDAKIMIDQTLSNGNVVKYQGMIEGSQNNGTWTLGAYSGAYGLTYY
ncbi:surface-anchored protein [Stylonychia lemnae]|uniref:Surface-anchored protein n=1 Tax=Stylonychia lemnae TaxID=5949 RepID=A0A078BBI4_STYLE|nr:surface-anchored protein [Stylonychia lemnae]|eukprot:CDW90918.1 surface-anchored protein [Stylonychia lemnae]